MSGLSVVRKPVVVLWVALVVAVLFHLDYLLHNLRWSTHDHPRRINVRNPDGVTGEINLVHLHNHTRHNLTADLAKMVSKKTIKMPDISDVLTYLKNKPNVFDPALKISKNRQNVTIVIGMPHVDRHIAFYLNDTLKSVIGNLAPDEANDCLIVVMFCDKDHAYNMRTAKATANAFPKAVDSGLLDLIVTPPAFYPDLNKLATITERNGDSIERWIWRSRENLDAAFLINYAYRKARFYVMSEDDVITVPGYFSKMKQFATKPPRQNWYIMGFSEYGSKGILFKSRDCPMLVNFILNFYGAWPVDWLLDDFLIIWGCNKDTEPNCARNKNKLRLDYNKRLFLHIGYHSSLKGKIMNDVKRH